MLTRTHTEDGVTSTAVYSACERYRYCLTREWNAGGSQIQFIMLNPSTATEATSDNTMIRCERRARELGYGSLRVVNLFAWRDTDPRNMKAAQDPIGPADDAMILQGLKSTKQTVCAWGNHGSHMGRGPYVKTVLQAIGKPLYHLGLTKHGSPKHPLRLAYTEELQLW
mmetsp:Transcript_18162/g.33571  ORF Transcript_18162/g.33571 Transcript_18162/m.33571 type:complete len:168 (+) Transcript_18162:92-595(+)